MKRMLTILVALSFVLSGFSVDFSVYAKEPKTEIAIYCAPDGDDRASGTIDAPLATFEGAKEKVLSVKHSNPDTPITVYFRGGEYKVGSTVAFAKKDSGTEAAPITYKAYKDEIPEFTGAIKLTANDFVSTTPSEQKRILQEARKYVSVASLKKLGVHDITDYEGHDVNEGREYVRQMKHVYNEFLYNGKPQTIAQWPNGLDEYASLSRVNNAADLVLGDESKERIYNWAGAENPILFGWFSYGYTYHRVPVKTFIPEENRVLTPYNIPRDPVATGRYKVANLLEELDIPGEYYLDTKNLKLYYYPPYPDTDATMELVLNENDFFSMDDASHIIFDGFNFGKTRANVFRMKNSKNISILGCTFRNVGLMGVNTMFCTDVTVDGCDFFYMGSTSVRFDERVQSDFADITVQTDKLSVRTDLTPDNNVLNNCYFYDVARQSVVYTGAVRIHGVGNTMSNNSIHNARSSLVHHGGNDIKIINNEMWSALKCVHDMGMIYNGRQLVQRGNEFAYNILHDVTSCNEEQGYAFLIYNDDSLGGVNIHHNILSDGHAPVSYSGGPDAQMNYNIIASNEDAGGFRGFGYLAGSFYMGSYTSFVKQQIPMVYTLKAYEKYDNLKELFFMNRWLAYGNEVKGNLFWRNGTKPTMTDNFTLLGITLDDQIITDDLSYKQYFNDPDNGDYSIKQDIEVPKELEELQKINPDDVGIYLSDTRDSVDYKLGEFKAYYPNNYTDNYNNKGAYFAWEQSENADEYIIELASDPDFEEILYTQTCPFNYAYITELESGHTVYYWRVKAISNRISNREVKMCTNDAMVFRTSLYDILDTALLEKVYEQAQKQLPQISEGIEPGQVAYGQLAEVNELVELAQKYIGSDMGSQNEIDELTVLLQNALSDMYYSSSVYYEGTADIFENSEDWVSTHNIIQSVTNDEVTLLSNDASTLTALTNVSKPMAFNSIKRFKLMGGVPKDASSSVWQAIAWIPKELAGTKWYTVAGAQGIMMTIKSDTVELQLRDGVNSAFVLSAPTPLRFGEYSDVELGCIDCGGGQRWIVNIDGKNIFDYVSTDMIITKDLYFTLHDAPVGGGTTAIGIKPADSKEPILCFGDRVSFGELDFAKEMGTDTVSVSDGASFSAMPIENDYTIKAVLDADTTSGAQGIIFRADIAAIDAGTMYELVFENGTAMLKRRKNSIEHILSIADCTKIDGEIKINARTTANGFNITVDMDGVSIIDCIDEDPILTKGYFGIFSNSSNAITLKVQ